MSFAGATLVLVLVALVANFSPSRRAAGSIPPSPCVLDSGVDRARARAAVAYADVPVRRGLKTLLEDSQRGLVLEALEATRGNQRQAAFALGVLPATLDEKLKRLGLGPAEPFTADARFLAADPTNRITASARRHRSAG